MTQRLAVQTAATVLLILTAPLLLLVACLVRLTSNGSVLARQPGRDRRGHHVDLLSFRTTIDGAGTRDHARLRAVVGAGAEVPTTAPGALLRRTRLDRLPRLINLAAGHTARDA